MITINKKNFVKETLSSLHFQTLIEILIAIAGFFVMVHAIDVGSFLVFSGGALAFLFGGYLYQSKITQARIWRSGLTGQKKVEETLSSLDDRYTLINNLSLPFKNCVIYHVLIGPKGIFLLETKHYKGEVSCIGDRWEYQKIGRNGGIYRGYISNPSRQLKRNIWELKTYLDKRSRKMLHQSSFPYWIQGVVVFTNDDVVVRTKDETVLIVTLNQLLDFIKNYKNEILQPKDVSNIVKMFKEL